MKRRTRGEQMLAAAGLASPASVLKPVQQRSAVAANDDIKSPPAKRARSSAKGESSAAHASQQPGPSSPPAAEQPYKLPSELELLASMFDALRTGRMMLKRRSEKVTYNSVRQVVENMTKREFRVEHLAQMKHLRPDAFDWQYIRTPSAANPLQLETQLLLTFDKPMTAGADSLASGGGGSVGRYNASGETAEFRAALEAYARANPLDPETGKMPPIPQAPLPPRPPASGSTPARSASLPLGGLASPAAKAGPASPGGSLGLQPAASCPPGLLPQAGGSGSLAGLASPGGSSLSAASPSPSLARTRSRLGLPPAALPPSLTPILEGTPTRHGPAAAGAAAGAAAAGADGVSGPSRAATHGEGDVTLEDEEDGGEALAAGADGAAAGALGLELSQQQPQQEHSTVTSTQRTGLAAGAAAGAGAACTPQSKGPRPAALTQTTPVSAARDADPRLARLHSLMSPAALQKIRETEAAQAAQTPEAKRRAEMRRAVQLLPHAYDLVRLIFGIQGPTVKPLSQVSQSMCERSTQRQGLTARDASNTLVALARAVPEFLRIEDPRVMADGSARPRSVAISRAANINAVAAKLKALAADPDAAVDSIFGRGAAGAAAAAPPPSPAGSMGAASVMQAGGESPAAGRLQPRALALALGDEPGAAVAGGNAAAAVGDMPPPPPSARKRPPGLPLPPPSPQVCRGGQTPTRSRALRDGAQPGGSEAVAGAAAAGPLPLPLPPAGTPSRALPPVAAGGAELLQKLCRAAPSPAAKPKVDGSTDCEGAAAAVGAGAVAPIGGTGASAGRMPGRGTPRARTPGRTAVQEAMLNSTRRSSAKRSSQQRLSGGLGVEQGAEDSAGEEEQVIEDKPKPRRLLLDD